MAPDTTRTERPIGEDSYVAQLSRHATVPFDQFIAADHTSTDAGADGEITISW